MARIITEGNEANEGGSLIRILRSVGFLLFKSRVQISRLRFEISRSGSQALKLKRALQRMSFLTSGFIRELRELTRN